MYARKSQLCLTIVDLLLTQELKDVYRWKVIFLEIQICDWPWMKI